jgi:hypothetical protein
MRRRAFLQCAATGAMMASGPPASPAPLVADPATRADWTQRWERYILNSARDRRCDTETGEEVGWLVSPYLGGFYYGYLATRQEKWIEMLVDWADSWIARAVKEPDGFPGWPKVNPNGHEDGLYGDSMLGEAMALGPVVMASAEILKTPALKRKWGTQARKYLDLSLRLFEKWEARGCWRETANGGLWVEAAFGIDRQTGQWTPDYTDRNSGGFSHPDNKENAIADWMLAMYDVTGKSVYRDRSASWFRLMRLRMKLRDGGKYFVWNYWEPAGAWDYKSDGSTKHWVGVHPNGGYYSIDVNAIIAVFEHGLGFTKEDIGRLIATNRDFMWNQEVRGARFQRIDGGPADPRWSNSPGVLWSALARYDSTLRAIFLANHNPGSWSGMTTTPWALSQTLPAAYF